MDFSRGGHRRGCKTFSALICFPTITLATFLHPHFDQASFGAQCWSLPSPSATFRVSVHKIPQLFTRILSYPTVGETLLIITGLGNAAFDDIDKATLAAFQAGVTDIADPVAREALRLPAGRGGMGLRSIRDSAPLAFIGATVAARALRHHLVTRACAARIEANPDPRVSS